MEQLLAKLYQTNHLTHDEIVELLGNLTPEGKKELFRMADETRQRHYGKAVFMRGLVEFSNICKQDCLYCGLRRSNPSADRYRLTDDEILSCIEEGHELGYRSFVLQSGEDFRYTDASLAAIIRRIKSRYPEVAITLSVGERSEACYQAWFEAGADRYLLRHETASRELYETLHPGMSYDNRVQCLTTLKRIGYQVGAGFMVGLPGQTARHLADDLLFLHDLQPEMIGIGPFIPHSATPLAHESGGTVDQSLVMIALARLFIPDAMLPATTAMGTLDPVGREKALRAGANVVMPILSPLAVREKYALYENKICTGDEASHCRHCIEMRIVASGYQIDLGRGDHCSVTGPCPA
ncbi:[FeFe] hydrogenase H-cluster radical SAM maturase HydE [Gorillibacterium sp. CAU 1737]|uniref:[FeFe] hydrogenase H-cluster radical SAM maturase HydE n=1 Tax=Gorillibacterium sp. CAU 1737 TaxID=3140362 RepID=UPI0032619F4A